MGWKRHCSGVLAWLGMICVALPAAASTTVTFLTLEYPPYTSESMPAQGAMLEVLNGALAGKGYDIRVVFLPWARVPLELRQGNADGVLPCWQSEIGSFGLQASMAVFESRLGFYVRDTQAATQKTDLPSLHGKKIGTVRGYGYPDNLLNAGLILEAVNDDETNLKKLASNRIDTAAMEHAVGEYLMSSRKTWSLNANVRWQEPAFASIPLYFGIVPGRPGAAKLLRDINEGIEQMKRDGRFASITQRNVLDLPGAAKRRGNVANPPQ
ncbi:hypothetical protein IGB42_03424 [Andreprevotia sp. IGB-42]|uniref:substrate-binding periplasmic protein n=1 Tax=Andreprevotia sp. IGB-42 TaxID=2497473 RepID=UPI00135CA80B|nr:transporter substrate-binding domain-containing protein [Andreprevotia sp. IGB-42]KAF0812147.1 hypothetical protein IGB42_03424 [Andreprevotia sp. IGB-42]